MIGDSHAMQWAPALADAGRRLDASVVYSGVSACPAALVDVERKHVPYAACRACHDGLPALLAGVHPAVVVAASSSLHLNGLGGGVEGAAADAAWQQATLALRALVEAQGARLVVVHDTPHLGGDPLACLARAAHDGVAADCSVERADADRVSGRARRAEIAAGVAGLDAFALVCPGARCPAADAAGPLYWDDGHLTQRAARGHSAAFVDALRPLLERP